MIRRLNRGADPTLLVVQPRDEVPKDQFDAAVKQYDLNAQEQQALRFIMTYGQRGAHGRHGPWPSGQDFPTNEDLSKAVPQIKQYYEQQGGKTSGSTIGDALKRLLGL